MKTDVQCRGFALTQALEDAVAAHASHYRSLFPRLSPQLMVRLFDINAARGGRDKCCLVHARLGKHSLEVVTNSVDDDLYLAIANAFAKLSRSTQSVIHRQRQYKRFAQRRALGLAGSEASLA